MPSAANTSRTKCNTRSVCAAHVIDNARRRDDSASSTSSATHASVSTPTRIAASSIPALDATPIAHSTTLITTLASHRTAALASAIPRRLAPNSHVESLASAANVARNRSMTSIFPVASSARSNAPSRIFPTSILLAKNTTRESARLCSRSARATDHACEDAPSDTNASFARSLACASAPYSAAIAACASSTVNSDGACDVIATCDTQTAHDAGFVSD